MISKEELDNLRTDVQNIPNRDWGKRLEAAWDYRGKSLGIYSVEPQAHLIAVTQPVGLLEGFSADAVLVKAFQKNYHTEAAKPGVVAGYGFEQQHAEPIEQISFVYETIFDRACEAEMNRYRHNSKNYESGRFVDYVKHGLTVVIPDDIQNRDSLEFRAFISHVMHDFEAYLDVLLDCGLSPRQARQQARRRLGFYLAVEATYTCNLRSLWHMARQRSHELSPNGKEAEPQISSVVTQMVEGALPYIPVFADDLIKQIGKGYR